jgi:hypothetical protein
MVHMPKRRAARATKRTPRKKLALRKMTIRDLDPHKGVTIKGGSFKNAGVSTSPL